MTTSDGGPVTVNSGFALEEDLVTRRKAPAFRLNLLSALETAKLHQTMDKQRPVPAIENRHLVSASPFREKLQPLKNQLKISGSLSSELESLIFVYFV